MKIIVGLGNVGDKYTKTRHNAGFMALDEFVRQIEAEEGITVEWSEDKKFQAYTAKVPYQDQILLLVKPVTYMNLSGEAVSKVLNFFKEPLENLIVLFDDIDLPLGTIRFKEKGSAGTHNGMRSIIHSLGSEDFPRIKIGVESRGTITSKQQDLSSFVLASFVSEEVPILKKSLQEAVEKLKDKISLT